jgi:hypothetical protein
MTTFELIRKMALAIKRTIDAADTTQSAFVGHLPYPPELCTLPKQLRRDLGECLDDLNDVEAEDK